MLRRIRWEGELECPQTLYSCNRGTRPHFYGEGRKGRLKDGKE